MFEKQTLPIQYCLDGWKLFALRNQSESDGRDIQNLGMTGKGNEWPMFRLYWWGTVNNFSWFSPAWSELILLIIFAYASNNYQNYSKGLIKLKVSVLQTHEYANVMLNTMF